MMQSPRRDPVAVPSSETRELSGCSILGEASRGAAAHPARLRRRLAPFGPRPRGGGVAWASADLRGWVVAIGAPDAGAWAQAGLLRLPTGQHPVPLFGPSCPAPRRPAPQPA